MSNAIAPGDRGNSERNPSRHVEMLSGDTREERALLAATLAAAIDSIITVDEEGRVLEFNASAEATFGYRREEALGRPIAELIVPPHLRTRHIDGMRRYLATSERHVLGRRVEVEGMRADGSVFPVELAIAEVQIGERRLFTAYLRDLTERRRAEQALRDSERQFRAVVEDQTELICRYDTDFRLTFSNRAHAQLFGVQPEALIGQDFFASIPAELRLSLREELLALTPERPVSLRENEKTLSSGEVRWFAWANHALFDEAGRRVGYQTVGRDISDAKRSEQALRESEARFVAAAESIPDGLMILDADDRVAYFNSRHVELLPTALRETLHRGIRFEDWIRKGRTRGPIYHSDMGPDYLDQRLRTRRDGPGEFEHKHADSRWVRIREGRMPDGGRVLLTIDITARQLAREALERSEARYRAVVEGQTEFILRRGPSGELTFVNEAYCRHRGLSREVLLSGVEDISRYAPAQRDRIRAAWALLSPERPTVTFELEDQLPTGKCYEEWTSTAIFGPHGQLVEVQAVGRDITERKRVEVEVRQQREAMHQQEKLASLGSLLAGVAHELNNPLSVVLGRAILLEEEAADPATRTSLARLRAAAERCARIVKSFLALARQRSREPTAVQIHQVMDAALEMLAYGIRSAGIEVIRRDARELPAILADEDQIHQVLLNLILNTQQALEAVPQPRRLWLSTAVGPDRAVRIEVADNGAGIPESLRDKVFDPFFTTKPVGAGTGLGLSVSHGIIAAHQGTIEVMERPGGGACFVVSLPTIETAAVEPIEEEDSVLSGNGSSILIVDDEPELLDMLDEALSQDGHQITSTTDATKAVDLVRSHVFDAVLCDLRMPQVDGVELARQLTSLRPELAERILLMTGDLMRAAHMLPSEFRDRLVEKPLDPQALRRRLQELIRGS